MRRRLFKLIGAVFALAVLTGLSGCGDSDFLDEPTDVYSGSIIFTEAGADADEGTISIDVLQNLDCDGDGVLDDPEPFGPVYVELTVSIGAAVHGLTLFDYDIEYIPRSSPLAGGGTVTPVALEDDFDHGYTYNYFPSGASTTVTFTFMTTQTKGQYVLWWAGGAPQNVELDQGRYTFRLTCYFEDDYGVERAMTFERTVYLGNFDRCS